VPVGIGTIGAGVEYTGAGAAEYPGVGAGAEYIGAGAGAAYSTGNGFLAMYSCLYSRISLSKSLNTPSRGCCCAGTGTAEIGTSVGWAC